MYDELLNKVGLSKDQTLVYQALLKCGFMLASRLSTVTGIKRGLVYKVLEQLISQGLVEKREDLGKVTIFFPSHPGKIKELLSKKEEELKTAEVSLSGIMGKLVSDWNLLSGKPNVQFFEGNEGFTKVAEDSLSSETEICQYMDIDTVLKEVHEADQKYAKKWKVRNIPKRIIYRESPTLVKEILALKSYNAAARSIITPETWNTVVQIYENKVSYVCFKGDKKIGVIIEDPHIYKIQKMLFDQMWSTAKPLLEFPQANPAQEIR